MPAHTRRLSCPGLTVQCDASHAKLSDQVILSHVATVLGITHMLGVAFLLLLTPRSADNAPPRVFSVRPTGQLALRLHVSPPPLPEGLWEAALLIRGACSPGFATYLCHIPFPFLPPPVLPYPLYLPLPFNYLFKSLLLHFLHFSIFSSLSSLVF